MANPKSINRNESNNSLSWKIENPHKIHILLVEDNMVNQMIIKNLLSTYGYQVTIANNGEQAIQQWKHKKNQFSLILMDLRMPIKDGYQATSEIRKIEKEESVEEIPIVALTASESPEEIKMATSIGMNEYLTKPINKQLLEETIWRFFFFFFKSN
jgi:CheY-like chemotaxis protein